MNRVALRIQRGSGSQGLVCQFCQFTTSAPQRLPVARLAASALSHNRPLHLTRQTARSSPCYLSVNTRRFASNSYTTQSVIRDISQEATALHNSSRVPSNEAVVKLMKKCQELVESVAVRTKEQGQDSLSSEEGNAISSLLDMEEKSKVTTDPRLADTISRIATEILRDEKVFISPEALEHYTKIQTLLQRAEHFPEIFHLYANKPVPEENSSPAKYHKANPKSVNSAVPAELANMALDVAIAQKNLSLALAIIDNTFCAPAFHRAKIFRKAGVPLAGLAAAPAACYGLASFASNFQNTMDPSTATGIAFAASLAYVGGTASIGILAITTANDQMERVVWLPGVPLRHRWLREEERAAMDKVALAWGFEDPYMRGEEVGEEWESLREFIGMRGMILDKTDLMHGME